MTIPNIRAMLDFYYPTVVCSGRGEKPVNLAEMIGWPPILLPYDKDDDKADKV